MKQAQDAKVQRYPPPKAKLLRPNRQHCISRNVSCRNKRSSALGSLNPPTYRCPMSLTPTDVPPVQFPASLSPRPCTCVAAPFTWQDLPALPVMAILARSSFLPGLTVSCHGWRLICILQLESVVSALVLLMRRTVGRHAVITYCTLAIRPRPQQQAYAAVVKVGAFVIYMDSFAANRGKPSCIHFKNRYSFATEIQLSKSSNEVELPTSFCRLERVTQLFRQDPRF